MQKTERKAETSKCLAVNLLTVPVDHKPSRLIKICRRTLSIKIVLMLTHMGYLISWAIELGYKGCTRRLCENKKM